MSLHDVVLHLLRKGLPTSETERDELIAQVQEDQAARASLHRPNVVPDWVPPAEVPPRFDPATGERLT